MNRLDRQLKEFRKVKTGIISDIQGFRQSLEDPQNLVLDPENARVHNEENIKTIGESLKKFGFRKNAIVVQEKTRHILAGNGICQYCIENQIDIVPVLWMPEDMSEKEAMAFGLVDNRAQETSEWNFAKLQDNLNAINDNFKPDELGFDDEFLDKAFEGFDEIEKMFNADETDKNKDKNAPQFIKIVIRAEDLSIIEKAITATNANTRGKALATICRDYLNNEKNIN